MKLLASVSLLPTSIKSSAAVMAAQNDFPSIGRTLRYPMTTSKGATHQVRGPELGFAPREITMENDGHAVSVL